MSTRHTDDYRLRNAVLDDADAIRDLIARSIRTLGAADYRPAQIEGALLGAFGLDTQLVVDGTYFVLEHVDGGLAACGGWSGRRTLFGGDARADRDDARLRPGVDAAKIRAFFVDPRHARRGLGAMLLAHCERAAGAAGFDRFELMATLPGTRLYERYGYVGGATVLHPLPDGGSIEFVPMHKVATA